jgi:hypothetical protein
MATSSQPAAEATVLTFFASSSARPADALEDVLAHVPVCRTPKTLQGQVLFASRADHDLDDLAARLLRLTTVDYVHVMLASCGLGDSEGGALASIRDAAASVSEHDFGRALALWRAVGRLSGRAAPVEDDALVFRSLGKVSSAARFNPTARLPLPSSTKNAPCDLCTAWRPRAQLYL